MEKVIVFGSTGRIGQELVPLLEKSGYTVLQPNHHTCDLLSLEDTYHYLKNNAWDSIINLAGVTTTIQLNQEFPADIAYETLTMNMNLLECCQVLRPRKLINIISSCAYANANLLKEENFLNGTIHESVLPHGSAKREVYLLSQYYRQQYKVPVTCVCFNAVVGNEKWHRADTLKVLPALVKKIVDAQINNLPSVEVWGSGKTVREFIHAKDAASGLLAVFTQYNGDLINVGTGADLSIEQLSRFIKALADYKGHINFNSSHPDGQLTKLLSLDRCKKELQWDYLYSGWVTICKELIREYKHFLETNK